MKFKQLLTKTLLVAVCLLAGQSVWGQITSLPFNSNFTESSIAPFVETDATVNTIHDNNNDLYVLRAIAEKNGTAVATAYFDSDTETEGNQEYTLGTGEAISISFTAFHGYYAYSETTKFAVVNSKGVELVSYTYNPNAAKVTDVSFGGTQVAGFESFAARSYYTTSQEANGFNDSSRPYVSTAGYNPTITILIRKNGEVSINFNQSQRSLDKTFSATLDNSSIDIDLDNITITNAISGRDNNSARVPGFANISIKSMYDYSVVAKAGGTTLKTLATGTEPAGSTIYYHFNQVLNKNGTLYKASSISSGYKTSFILDSGAKVVNHSYSQPGTPITNIVFLAEGEDLFTTGTGSSADTRCSMGAGGYASSKTEFVTLPAGEYYLVMSNRCSGDRTGIHKFYKGSDSDPFFSADGHGYNEEHASGKITLTETTTLYFQGGDKNQYVDWLYIYGTPSNEIVGAVDYSTGYLDDMTNKVTLSPGESYNYKFINHNSGSSSQWLNYVVPVYTSADVKTLVIRADNWEDMKGTNAGCTNNFVWGDANATFISEMNGAIVDMTINYSASNVLTMNAVIKTKSGYDWTYSYRTDYSESGISLAGDIKVALSVSNSWLELVYEGTTGTVTKTISDAGWATYCSPYALDLANATGLTDAYIVTGGENGVLTKTSVMNGTVPANTGLLLKGNEGTATIPVVANSSTDVSANKLIGVTAETPIAAETGYVLLKENDVLGFYKNSNVFTVGANTAYLPASFSASARASYLLFFDDVTGISQVAGSEVKTSGAVYNLNGQRVSNPTKGIYIIDGVKVAIE